MSVTENHEYVIPTRKVVSVEDMPRWRNSEAYHEYKGFLQQLNEAVRGKSLSSQFPESPSIAYMINLLNEIIDLVDDFPPIEQPSQRFGNKAFRSFYEKFKQEAENILKKHLPEQFHKAIPEISVYLVESVGNSTRIDYGTGHEMAFLWHLSCLFKIGFFSKDDKAAVALKVFNRYLVLVRKLQTTYRMEPAGSRGVWSLDDFQFVPFIWGSAQLMGHPRIEPSSFNQDEVVNSYADDFLFIACIRYINQVKTGPFYEHSHQLWSLSGSDSWRSINQKLINMHEKNVLDSFPLVQHALFGSLMPITPSKNPTTLAARPRPMPPKVDIAQLPPPKN